MKLEISNSLKNKLINGNAKVIEYINRQNNFNFSSLTFYNRIVKDLNDRYSEFQIEKVEKLSDIPSKTSKQEYVASIKNGDEVIGDVVIAYSEKNGNTFVSQQFGESLIDKLYSNNDYIKSNVKKIVYSTYNRAESKDQNNSNNFVLRLVKTIGYDVVEMFPFSILPEAYNCVDDILNTYNNLRTKKDNKTTRLDLKKGYPDELTLKYDSEKKGSGLYYYYLILLAIYRVAVPKKVYPKLSYSTECDDNDSITNKFKSLFNERLINYHDNVSIPKGKGVNLLIYGAPGTGKSFYVNKKYGNNLLDRITFYPDYDYSSFVGGLRPVRNEENEGIDYRYIAGPFTRAIVKALKHPDKEVDLVIEELNRAEAASVFGDTFQLLDRESNGISTYSITNKDLSEYIDRQTDNAYKFCDQGVKLPGNLSIIATMNPADQGVFPLDTAFKRRWQLQYRSINWNRENDNNYPDIEVPGFGKKWKDFAKSLNDVLLDKMDVNEDSLLGQFFFKSKDEIENKKLFASKLFGYLWNDVLRYKRTEFFRPKKLGDLISRYISDCDKQGSSSSDLFSDLFSEEIAKALTGEHNEKE